MCVNVFWADREHVTATSSAAEIHFDFVCGGQAQRDAVLIVSTVHARLPEGAGVLILLPVVMPVPLLVSAEPEHVHLQVPSNPKWPLTFTQAIHL